MRTMQYIENLIANMHAFDVNPDIADDAADLIERMYDWLKCDCECPCCLSIEQCGPGCTFSEDAPSEAEHMAAARCVLFGD